LTPFSGDPDIYVGCDEENLPTEIDYEFASAGIGNETLIITESDRANLLPTGYWYIGIYGYLASTFSLLVSINQQGFVMLSSGLPTNGFVNYN